MSDRPFGGKKEEEGTLARSPVKNSVYAEISWCGDVRYIYVFLQNGGGSICSDFQRRGGGRGFDRFIGNSKGVRSNPPPTRLVKMT